MFWALAGQCTEGFTLYKDVCVYVFVYTKSRTSLALS